MGLTLQLMIIDKGESKRVLTQIARHTYLTEIAYRTALSS